MLYTQQLSVMVRVGIPIDRALNFLATGTDRRLNQVFTDCARQVSSGKSLSEALREHPRVFPPIYPALVYAGEHSGALVEVLTGLADYLAKRLQYRRQLQAALVYPLALLACCTGLLLILLIFVIPAMQPLFAQLGVPLPWLTRAVLALADLLRQPKLVLGGLMVVLTGAVLLQQLLEADPESYLRLHLDRRKLSLPGLGPLLSQEISARFCSSLGLMLCSGQALDRSLRGVTPVVDNTWVAAVISVVNIEIMDGKDFSWAAAEHRLLPPMAVAFIRNAEEAGQLGETLLRVGRMLSEDLEERFATLSSLLEPLFLAFTSAIVGVVSIAALLPWIQLLSQFS